MGGLIGHEFSPHFEPTGTAGITHNLLFSTAVSAGIFWDR
jgi:hypothetical protein